VLWICWFEDAYTGGDTSGTTTLLSRIVGTLGSGTHQPQSGDAFARLGAPAGASISADIATRATFGTPVTLITSEDIIPGGLDWTLAGIRDNVLATKLKTDHLPSSPASSGDVAAVGAAVAALHDFDPVTDTVAHVTLVDTVTTLTQRPDVPTEAEIAAQVRVELADELASITAMEERLAAQVPDGPVAVIPSPGPGQTTVWIPCYDHYGNPEAGVKITLRCIKNALGGAMDSASITMTSDAEGMASTQILRGVGARYLVSRGAGSAVIFNSVDEETIELPPLLGAP
jgi:hypothetical protein